MEQGKDRAEKSIELEKNNELLDTVSVAYGDIAKSLLQVGAIDYPLYSRLLG